MTKSQKVVLITGAARRVGAAIAILLHKSGMNVVLHYNHSEQEAKALCDKLNQERPHSAIILKADLVETSALEPLIKKSHSEWGRLDVLVNNASKFYRTDIGSVTETAWADLMDSNLKAPFFLCQAAAPFLREVQGSIVNITDVHGERPMPEYPVYCITKAGLLMLTRVLAKEMGPDVRVNAVSPGTVEWPEGENTLNAEQKKKIINKIALARHGTADDIAKAVLFLVHDADFVTGQVISVDGGRLLAM